MTNKTCGECKHLNRELAFCRACGAKWLKDTDGANCKYFEKITKPTNGDKIRQMSDEELALMIVPKVMFCDGCPVKCEENAIPLIDECPFGTDNIKNICVQRVIAWLKQEAKDE